MEQLRLNQTRISFEWWDFLPTPGSCYPRFDELPALLKRLEGRRVVIIGDSLTRNLVNAMIDVVNHDECSTSKHMVSLVDGKVWPPVPLYEQPMCSDSRVNGHRDGVGWLAAYNLTFDFLWNPWMPAWNQSNCTREMEELPVFSMNYFKAQAERNCAYFNSLLSEVLESDPDALVIYSYTVTSIQMDKHDEFVFKELPVVVQQARDRALFVAHTPHDKVRRLVDTLEKAELPFVYYADIVADELMYDKWHCAGPVQMVAARSVLAALADMAT